jgi:hypothetical protein
MDASVVSGSEGFSLQNDELTWSHAARVKERKRSDVGPIKYYLTGYKCTPDDQ